MGDKIGDQGRAPSKAKVGRRWVGTLVFIMIVFSAALGARLVLIARGFARSDRRVAAAVTSTLWFVFIVLVALGGVVATALVRAEALRRAAEQDDWRRTTMLEADGMT